VKKSLSLLLSIVMVFSGLSCLTITSVGATQDRTSYFNKNYTLTGNPIDDIVAIAQAQKNRTQTEMGYTEAWCANFVGDCASLAGLSDCIPSDGYCGTLYNNIINAGGKEVTSPQKGDIVFYICTAGANNCPKSGYPWVHVGIMTSSSTSIEGNSNNKVTAKTRISYTDRNGHTYGHSGTNSVIVKYLRPNYPSQEPPTNVTLTSKNYWYDLEDTVVLYPRADNASYCWLSVYKDDVRIVDSAVTDEYSFDANKWGVGTYNAWITAVNSIGKVDSEHISFPVVDKTGYTDVYASDYWYDLNDTVKINVDTICAKGQAISIFKNGTEKVISEDCDSTFTISASDKRLGVGEYSAYFTVYNSSHKVDTKWITFSIVGKPSYTEVKSDKCWYDLNDTVTITVSPICAHGQAIGIDKNNIEKVISEDCNNTYTIPASKLGVGKYSAYFTLYNHYDTTDTKRVYFEIVDEPKEGYLSGHCYVSEITNTPSCIANGTKTYTCSTCGDTYTETLPVTGHTEVVDKGYEATYEKEGLTDGLHCSVCDKVLVEQEIIPILVMLGDVDSDGKVRVVDATCIQRHLAEIEILTGEQLVRADTYKDGKVTILDATQIQRLLAELIPEL